MSDTKVYRASNSRAKRHSNMKNRKRGDKRNSQSK